MTLSLDTAYRSFGGEVEASSTPTICRLPDSRRHQLSAIAQSEGMPPKRYGVGDVIFFRSGAHVKWHVEGYVKKVSFCRQTNPIGFGFAIRGINRLKRMFLKLPAGPLLRFCFSAAILNGSV